MKRMLLVTQMILLSIAATASGETIQLQFQGDSTRTIINTENYYSLESSTYLMILLDPEAEKNWYLFRRENDSDLFMPLDSIEEGEDSIKLDIPETDTREFYGAYLISPENTPDPDRTGAKVFYLNPPSETEDLVSEQNGSGNGGTEVILPFSTAAEWVRETYPSLVSTPAGLELPENSLESQYTGSGFTHIFLDQNGNPICSVIPRGIPGRQYVVHVVYMATDSGSPIDYLVTQTAGLYSDESFIRNAELAGPVTEKLAEFTGAHDAPPGRSTPVQYSWRESVTCLNTSTTDMELAVKGIVYGQGPGSNELVFPVATGRIPVTPLYHGSLELGVLNSTLSDPDYRYIAAGDSTGVVTVSNEGDRGMVTLMATLYSSPVVWIESIWNHDIPSYNFFGRSSLNDHLWYQRFYPSFGIELGSDALENYFLGLSFEFAKGGSLFGGFHYGRVSVMDTPPGFQEGETQLSPAEFQVLTDRKWKADMAYGLNMDLSIIARLFDLQQ